MDGINLAEHLLKKLRERKEDFSTSLSDGAINSIEDYRFIVGQIRGMTYAEEEIIAAMKGIDLEDG
jgi:hypothetical protein|tara:strand:- start:1346 stop:1543 length:198 start_codon:yes stop_codon:yes gene_type:complete